MLTLTEFLLERIAEDERHAQKLAASDARPVLSLAVTVNHPQRILLECEAKRRIVERFKWAAESPDLYRNDMEIMDQWADAMDTLADLAAPYADHPDYDASWRP